MYMTTPKNTPTGFALLLALLVVSVVITVGLTILDITTKQVRLAASAADSEGAYSAANAGVECAMHWRRTSATALEAGSSVSGIACFGTSNATSSVSVTTTNGQSSLYNFVYDWGVAPAQRCSQITMLVTRSLPTATSSISNANMKSRIPSYPGSDARLCPPGGICTTISSRGYNRACGSTATPGTIQREVLVEF